MMAIQDFAEKLLSGLKQITQAETVIGQPIEADGATIIPVSRVSVGFGLGGNQGKSELSGAGGGASIDPIAFLVVKDGNVKLLPIAQSESLINKVIDMVPDVLETFKKSQNKAEEDSE